MKIASQNVRAVLNGALEILFEALQLKNIQLNDTVSSELYVEADETITKTVIRNILANAIKYAPLGSSINISARKEGLNLVLRIEDEGQGIPPDVQDKLFVESVKSRAGSEGELGTGLGPSLCHEFMQMQRGQMRLDRSYTAGAALELVLPLASS